MSGRHGALLATLATLALLGGAALAATPPFTGTDYSGTYDCRGEDSHEGAYTGVVTLRLVRSQSSGPDGAYSFRLDVPGYGSYPGHAAASGRDMAMFFAHTDPASKDYGTGIARFARTRTGQWAFRKFYYEPEFKGGNFGREHCVRR